MKDRFFETMNGSHIIDMELVQHIERVWPIGTSSNLGAHSGLNIITEKTAWNNELDCWHNAVYLAREEADKFVIAWKEYRKKQE